MTDLRVPLSAERLQALRALAEERGTTVEDLVRQAVEEWLDISSRDAMRWRSQLGDLLERRRAALSRLDSMPDQTALERDVEEAINEVRARRSPDRP